MPRFPRPMLALALTLASCGTHSAVSTKPSTPTAVAPKERTPSFGAPAIDAALRAEWTRAGVVPAPRADDATFLRRAYIDIVGTAPPVDVTTRFLADPSPQKRAALVDALLASPDYAEHWMNYWDDVLMGPEVRGNLVDRTAFRRWLQARFSANAPWDRVVTDLVSATGQNGQGGRKADARGVGLALRTSPASMGAVGAEPAEAPSHGAVPINGAVNWTLRFEQDPQDLGGTASRVFLGLQIQCAQCHDHKTESWKQDDFRRFSSAFFRSKIEFVDDGKAAGVLRRAALVDAASPPPRFTKKTEIAPLARAKATALDGTDLERGVGTRPALAAWMTSKDNPWFAKAFANRMWGHLLGRGFVDPVDDIRPSNTATMPALLDQIAADFVAHGFDIQHLIRTICATEAYQLAASTSASADRENHLWGHFHLSPLGPEEFLNAVFRVTDLEEAAKKAGIDDLDALRANVIRQYAFLFDTDEEQDAPQYSGTIAQALALLNGELVAKGSRALAGSMLGTLAAAPGTDASKVDALTMRVFARHATTEEQARWVDYIANATTQAPEAGHTARGRGRKGTLDRLANKRVNVSPKVAAYEDILWAMLNSSEFTFNH